MNIRFAALAALACCVAGVAIAHADIDIIAVRQAGMSLQGAALGAVKAAVGAGVDVKNFAGAGSAMSLWAKQIPSVFPAGTDKGDDTKALPTIWSDSAGFAKSAATLGTAADKLTAAAKANDKDAFAAAFKEVADACGACHKTFRAK